MYWGRCDLRKAISGRICFRIGLAVHCGGNYRFNQNESHTVTLGGGGSASAGGVGVNFSSSVSHQWTVGTQASRDIGPCESANPEVCFPDSVLKVFDCEYETLLTISWETEVEFEPGGTEAVVWNIIQDPNCCQEKAPGQVGLRSPSQSLFNHRTAPSIVVFPGHFALREPKSSPNETETKGFAANTARRLEDYLSRKDRTCGARSVGIATPDGDVAWLSSLSTVDAPPALGFLSGTRAVHDPSSSIALGVGETLPVVAVGSGDVNQLARLRVQRLAKNRVVGELVSQQVKAEGEKLKAFAAFVPADSHELEYGDRGRVLIDVDTKTGPRTFCQPFRVVRGRTP